MITDGKKWHYLTVKSFSALLKGITSNYKEGFYCLTLPNGGCYHIETSLLICGADQWTGFYMITASVLKGLNCFHSYSPKEKLKTHEKVCNDHDYFFVEMLNDENKMLKYNYGEKSLKVPAIIYADLYM